MGLVHRVLDASPVTSLDDYLSIGGGTARHNARELGALRTMRQVDDAGIRGRGGAGFPTARKWATITENASPAQPATVVVNAAEGEPGSFKDREILLRNPYRVLEGALIAARTVAADTVIVGMKRGATRVIRRVRDAITEIERAGWSDGIDLLVVEGPPEYLLGEETALLEVVDGRAPFPRIDPPFRRGVDEVVFSPDDLDTASSSAAHVELAAPGGTEAPPALVENVETLAHVALALEHGVEWFRSIGTSRSPGSFVCTVSGATRRAGVGELEFGTTLRDAIEAIGGGLPDGRRVRAVLQGVSAAVLTGDRLDTPLTWEDMEAAGSGLGASAFIVFDETTRPLAIAAAASRFLAVESCGQCRACKQDGLAISDALERCCRAEPEPRDASDIRQSLARITEGMRCSLAQQHQTVVESILSRWPDELEAAARRELPACEIATVVPMTDLVAEAAVIDLSELDKQPDWSHDSSWTGQWPADRLDDHRAPEKL